MNEQKISIYESSFTHSEVLNVTGIPDRTLHNWVHRSVIELTAEIFTPGGGRRLYAPLDIFKIAVMYELTKYTQFPPSEATIIMGATQQRVQERFDTTVLIEDKSELPLGLDLIFVIGPEEEPLVMHRFPGSEEPPNYGHPWLMIPVDQIIDLIANKLFELIDQESGE